MTELVDFVSPATVSADAVLALVGKFDTITTATGGCSDGYCLVTGKAKGMHTNGGCRCSTNRHAAQRVMQAARMLRDELEALTRGEK